MGCVLRLLTVFVLLVGCGGAEPNSGGGGGGGPVATTPDPTFSDLDTRWGLLVNSYDDEDVVEPETLPSSGSVTYSGIFNAAIYMSGAELVLAGEVSLKADFHSDKIRGDVRNVLDEYNAEYGGRLTVTDGVIDRSVGAEYTLSANLNGQLSSATKSLDVDSLMFGNFVGAGAQAISGVMDGNVTDGQQVGSILGGFVAER